MAKSPTRCSHRSDTPFTEAQEAWIIQQSAFMTPGLLFCIWRQIRRTSWFGHHGIHKRRLSVWVREIWKWWRSAGWLMGECWRWSGWWMTMVGRTPWPYSGIRRCCNSMSGRRSGTNPADKITGSCKTERHLTRPNSTSTFSSKRFVEGLSPVDCRWGTSGHYTILLTPLSGDLLRTKFDAFNRNWFQNNSRPWRTLQQPFQWRSCATQLKMCANAPRPESRLPVAISSISFSQCKNANSQLFNSIFGITVQWKLSEIFRFLRLQLAC